MALCKSAAIQRCFSRLPAFCRGVSPLLPSSLPLRGLFAWRGRVPTSAIWASYTGNACSCQLSGNRFMPMLMLHHHDSFCVLHAPDCCNCIHRALTGKLHLCMMSCPLPCLPWQCGRLRSHLSRLPGVIQLCMPPALLPKPSCHHCQAVHHECKGPNEGRRINKKGWSLSL